MHFKSFFPFLIPVLFILSACEKGTEDEIPSYISIDKVELIPDPDLEGREGSLKIPNITDAWVFVDNELIGVYETPTTIPILKSGTHTLRVDAGIMVNGISATRAAYPFYKPYKKEVNLVQKETLKIDPVPQVSYYPNTVFAWQENFETGVSIDSISSSSTQMQKCSDPLIVYEGEGCGVIYLDSNHPTYKGISTETFKLPKEGNYVFLEINIRTDNELYISLNGIEDYGVFIRNTKGLWKKFYINLTPYVSLDGEASGYKIYFRAIKEDSNTTASIFLDNIKLVHF
jgi:hypothetical protein